MLDSPTSATWRKKKGLCNEFGCCVGFNMKVFQIVTSLLNNPKYIPLIEIVHEVGN